MRLRRVSGFFGDSIQQIHSFLASGVISSQAINASGLSSSVLQIRWKFMDDAARDASLVDHGALNTTPANACNGWKNGHWGCSCPLGL